MATKRYSLALYVALQILLLAIPSGYAQCSGRLSLAAHFDYSGQISSPNYPLNYNNGAYCEWLVTPTSSGVAIIHIQEMVLETNYDYVYIYDEGSTTTTLLATYTGTTSSTTPLYSSGTSNSLLVRLQTDSSVTRTGFKLLYYAQYSSSSPLHHDWPIAPCGSTININTNDIHQLTLPNSPYEPYTSAVSSCTMTFSATSNLNVTILWSDLTFYQDQSSNTGCSANNGLSITEGAPSVLLYSLCSANQMPDETIVVYPTTMSVTFTYTCPSGLNLRGPIISVQAYGGAPVTVTVPVITTMTITSTCGYTALTAEPDSEVITSPGYPTGYSNSLSCTWLITVSNPATSLVQMDIDYLYTENVFDWLKVYDGPSSSYNQLGSYSGALSAVTLVSTGSTLYLHFTSDSSINHSGFYIFYKSITLVVPACVATYTDLDASSTQQVLYSHVGYPASYYPDNYEQYWLIRKPDITNTLTFYFTAFRLESCYDTLTVYSGACTTDDIEYVLCGIVDSDTKHTVALGRYVLFRMYSDYVVTYAGFAMRYYTGSTSDAAEEEDDVPFPSQIVLPCIVVVVIIIAIVGKVLHIRRRDKIRAMGTRSVEKVKPPDVNNYDLKIKATVKAKTPKFKPERQKIVKPPPPAPGPTPGPTPSHINVQMEYPPAPPYGTDPAYPPPPPGGPAPPMNMQPPGGMATTMHMQPPGGMATTMHMQPPGGMATTMHMQPPGGPAPPMNIQPPGGMVTTMHIQPPGGMATTMHIQPPGGQAPPMNMQPPGGMATTMHMQPPGGPAPPMNMPPPGGTATPMYNSNYVPTPVAMATDIPCPFVYTSPYQ